jgi:hypothetical protein
VEPRFVQMNGGDPFTISRSRNLQRRTLSVTQRAIAAALEWVRLDEGGNVQQGGDRRSDEFSNRRIAGLESAEETLKKLAAEFRVGEKPIRQARALIKRDPIAAEEVKNGGKDLFSAYEEMRERERREKDHTYQMERLQATDSVLWERVDRGELTLEAAQKQIADRVEQARLHRYSITSNLLRGLTLLEWNDDHDTIAEIVAGIDPVVERERGEQVTVVRLRKVERYCGALARALEGKDDR